MVEKYNVRFLDQSLFDYSKRTASLANIVRLLAYLLGVVIVLLSLSLPALPFAIAFLTILTELLQWRSDSIKSVAESLLRKLDFYEGLGWPISKSEISDILARSPRSVRNSIPWRGPDYQYFDSDEILGPKKALKNLVESAWWSKHLAETSGHLYLLVTLLSVVISIMILVISIEAIQNFSTLTNISRAVTSTILLIFSLRLIRSAIDYYTFSRKANLVENQARDLLGKQDIEKEQVIKVFQEYHFARNGSPLIPTWMWKARRSTLNELWDAFQENHDRSATKSGK